VSFIGLNRWRNKEKYFTKIIVSGCLLGEHCRYDGLHNYTNSKVLWAFQNQGRLIPYCPEVAGGLPTPRAGAEIVNGDGFDVINRKASVINEKGIDVTRQFIKGAKNTLRVAKLHHATVAILKQGSPSCGSKLIYDGTFSGNTIPGMGVTAALLTQNGIRVFSEENLDETAIYLLESEGKS
jgi:uncharacterized protein YbbK (DUF523 family)